MHNDAARFNRIKQPKTSGTDNKTPGRIFKHWRHFGMRPKIRKCEIELADKSHTGSFAVFFEFGENLEQVVFCALLPNDFRHAAVSRRDRVTLPSARRLPDPLHDLLAGYAGDPATPGLCPVRG